MPAFLVALRSRRVLELVGAIIACFLLAIWTCLNLGWQVRLLPLALMVLGAAVAFPPFSFFLFFSFLYANSFNFPVGGGVRLFHVVFAVAAAGLLYALARRRLRVPLDRLVPPELAIFLVVMLASLAGCVDLIEGGRLVTQVAFLLACFAILRAWGFLEGHREEFFRTMDRVMIAGSFALAVLGLIIYVAHLTGFTHDLFPIILSGFLPRLHFSEDPNHYAGFMLPGLIMSFPGGKDQPRSLWRKMAFGVILFAYILTISAGGFLTLGLLAVLMFFRFRFITPVRLTAVLLIGGMAYAGLALSGALDTQTMVLDSVFNQKSASSGERLVTWQYALAMGLSNPLLGVGPDNAKLFVPRAFVSGVPQDIHNGFLQIFAELGFTGLFLILVVIGRAIYNTWAVIKDPKIERRLTDRGYRYLTLLLCTCFGHAFLNILNTPPLWYALAVNFILVDALPKLRNQQGVA